MSIENKPNEQQTGADIVVKTLEQQNVKWVFGVPGAKIDKVFNTLVDSSIQTVVCRHEQNAAFIAGGIGRMTGKAGVAIATSGPGVSNLVTGLATANTEGDPVIALGGAVPLSDRLKKIHQTMDSVSLCKVVTKYSAEVDSPEAVSEVLTNAFRSAESGRPGAAFVSLPMGHHGGTYQVRHSPRRHILLQVLQTSPPSKKLHVLSIRQRGRSSCSACWQVNRRTQLRFTN
jgi:acetolactate synthase-1/2/3 large subunit